MTHHAKAPSAGSTQAPGSSRGLFRRALATRGGSNDSKGSNAPSSRRRSIALIAGLAGVASLACATAPALAAPPTTTTPVVSEVSYTSAKLTGELTTDGSSFGYTAYAFQYSTDGTHWNTAASGLYTEGAVADKQIEAPISVPKGGTTYAARIVAQNGFFVPDPPEAVSPGPNPEFTTLTVDPPAIPGGVDATPVFSTSATATAEVKRPVNADPAFDVNCRFEYVTDEQFTSNPPGEDYAGATVRECTQNPISPDKADGEGKAKVTAPLGCTSPLTEPAESCLKPETTYHLRLVAENAAPGTVSKEASSTFTTEPKVDPPTVVSIADATDVAQSTAKATGEVQRPPGTDPALNVSCRFEYVTEEQFGAAGFEGAASVPCAENPITDATADGEGNQAVGAELSLIPETTYHLRLSAENAGGTDSKDAANTFTTPAAEKPEVTIDPVAAGAYTTAHVSGTITGHGGQEFFQVSEDGGVTWSTFEAPTLEAGAQHVEHDYEGLSPNTTYTFRIAATYSSSIYYEAEARHEMALSAQETITTEELFAPTATINPVADVTATTAHLSGTVDPHAPAGSLNPLGKKAFATKWTFECVPECRNANGNPISGTVQGEEGAQPVSGDAIRLQSNSFYDEVKLIISSEGGAETVETLPFQTPLVKADVKAEAGAPDGEGGYTIQGVVASNNSKLTACAFAWGPNSGEKASDYAFSAPCLPFPSGPDEVQNVNIDATEGQFKLSFRGQSTSDLDFDATPAEIQNALRALSTIGSTGVTVTAAPGAYIVTFAGKLAGADVEPLKVADGTTPLGGGGGASVSTATEGGTDHPVTVEAHLSGLNTGVVYHFRIFATNAAGDASSVDRTFTPTLNPKASCPNEQVRKENSSAALPECRAYEMVSPPDKAGYGAELFKVNGGGAVAYNSSAGNIANSGLVAPLYNVYTATRSDTGWQTRSDLNGPTGSVYSGPEGVLEACTCAPVLSKDLLSTVYQLEKKPIPGLQRYLRRPDGSFTLLGGVGIGSEDLSLLYVGASDDFSRQVYNGAAAFAAWGPGVYETFGTDGAELRRVDVDNSANPISECTGFRDIGNYDFSNAIGNAVSTDGRVVVLSVAGGCGAASPPAREIWARVDATTSIDLSASQCNRTAADPGGLCSALPPATCGSGSQSNQCASPGDATFQGAAGDGSRVFFSTTRQLVDGDTDQTDDLYACDIPLGNPAPVGKANPCPSLRQISVAETGAAEVESVYSTSEDGSTVLFTAKGVLAGDEDALEERALDGDHNLYVWRQDASHPAGQTTFVARLDSDDLAAQSTPDGRYLVLATPSPLVTTDTDDAADVYRYDTESGQLTRASTGSTGVGGNVDGFEAGFFPSAVGIGLENSAHYAISDDGQKIIFNTSEALAPSDGNGNPDVYIWTPQGVALISAGSGPPLVGGNGGAEIQRPRAVIDGSGQDVYFESAAALTPADGDQQADVYDARVGGGFSFAEQICSGEACQPPPSKPRSSEPSGTETPGSGNMPAPKPCPKGKVRRHGKCKKKHTGKKHHSKKASHNRGGGK